MNTQYIMNIYRYLHSVAFLVVILLLNTGCGKKNNLSLPEKEAPTTQTEQHSKTNRNQEPK